MPGKTSKIEGLVFEWVGHSTVGIYGEKVIYVDPFSEILKGDERKADLIISTHGHRDHFDIDAINQLSQTNTHVVVKSGSDTGNLSSKLVEELDINGTCAIDGIHIKGVHAYNTKRFRSPGTPFHPEGFGMGVLVTVEGIKFYYVGDSDFIEPMKGLRDEKIDVAFMPIGGKYTMDLDEAVEAVAAIQPKKVVPVHYNHIEGTEADPFEFKKKVEGTSGSEVLIL